MDTHGIFILIGCVCIDFILIVFVVVVLSQKFSVQVDAFNLGEALQCIAYNHNTAFVAGISGKITRLNRDSNEVSVCVLEEFMIQLANILPHARHRISSGWPRNQFYVSSMNPSLL